MASSSESEATPMAVEHQRVPLTEDTGVQKEIIRPAPAENVDTPEPGDEVSVHYTGRLVDGTVFDSSVERGTPFTFKLGQGQVIKGWDIGVASMRKGEKAYLTCSPEYAYGKSGSPPKIPADATLIFEVELLSWTSHNDLTGDGGIIRKLVKASTHELGTKANTGNDVSVHFTVSLSPSNEEVYSTRTSNAPFEFSVGATTVPIAFNKLVTSMKCGEIAKATVTPKYAWGEQGSEAYHVPPNATVVIEMELLEVIKTANLLKDETGTLNKRILKDVTGEYKKPNLRASVTATLLIRNVGSDTPLLHHAEFTEFKLNQGDLPEVADLLLTTMVRGEVAEVTADADEFGYGVDRNRQLGLQAGDKLYVKAELKEIHPDKESWDMNVDEKLQAGARYKEIGNTYFKAQQYRRAQRQYKEAIEFFRYDSSLNDEEKKKANELKLPCHLNYAACALKLKEWRLAKENCDKALAIETNNVKALFRRAQAYLGTFDHELAQKDLVAAAKLEPANKDIRDLLRKIQDDLKAQTQREKQLFAGRLFKKPLFDHEKLDATKKAKQDDFEDMDSSSDEEESKESKHEETSSKPDDDKLAEAQPGPSEMEVDAPSAPAVSGSA